MIKILRSAGARFSRRLLFLGLLCALLASLSAGEPIQIFPIAARTSIVTSSSHKSFLPIAICAVEFLPGTAEAIHHAFIFFDDSGDARRLAGQSKI